MVFGSPHICWGGVGCGGGWGVGQLVQTFQRWNSQTVTYGGIILQFMFVSKTFKLGLSVGPHFQLVRAGMHD